MPARTRRPAFAPRRLSRRWAAALSSLAALALARPGVVRAVDWERVRGSNLTVEEGFGARYSGMAKTFLGMPGDVDALAGAPAAMGDADDLGFSAAHVEKFGQAKFDDFAGLFPIDSATTLGLGLARFGVDGIWKVGEGQIVNPDSVPHFSTADYLLVPAFARRWGAFDLGADLNLLYRRLEDGQQGFGMRGDAMAACRLLPNFRAAFLMKGLLPSSAIWTSGEGEYESPDLYFGMGWDVPAPYFYGVLHLDYQSEGWFQVQAKSVSGLRGGRVFSRPADVFQTGNLGLEYAFDFGLALRAGMEELAFSPSAAPSFGVGYTWKRMVTVDYSYSFHPEEVSMQRVAVRITPAFAGFNGLGFRARGRPGPVRAPAPAAAPTPTRENGVEPPPAAPPAPAAAPAAPQAPPDAAPAAPAGEKEELDPGGE